MTSEYSGDFFLVLAIVLGWLAIVPLAMAQLARGRFRKLLKAPLTDEVERLTHVWEGRVQLWMALGIALSGASLACFAAWLLL